jgi:hypothetical protein
MTGVQRAHGRHQRDSLAPRAPLRERTSEGRDIADHLRAAGLGS